MKKPKLIIQLGKHSVECELRRYGKVYDIWAKVAYQEHEGLTSRLIGSLLVKAVEDLFKEKKTKQKNLKRR